MKKLLFFLCFCTLLSCKKEYKTERSFCYWKTTFQSYNFNQQLADSLGVGHMYMRLFDVGWNPFEKKPAPMATLWDFSDEHNKMHITPSIYINNDAIVNSSREQLRELAANINKRTIAILSKTEEKTVLWSAAAKRRDSTYTGNKDSLKIKETANFKSRIKEILIDCDWTQKSRDNYFFLLSEIKRQFPNYKIAATIRLWQYRDFKKAGVPPVDNGLLMCYNMDSPTNHKTGNSIGSSKTLKQYITHNDYPLKLNVALPIFNWQLVFRGGEFKGILTDDLLSLRGTDYKKLAENRYMLTNDITIGQTYFRNGDEVRVEKVSDAELRQMIDIIKDNIDLENSRVTFFSWDENFINDYGTKNIEAYYRLFSN
ncbi:hypothetical protein AM493_03395 [Flavobacterium akiainvivens]|uniref:DUF4855 domain-containing protein n=1 Tax=Flavobacterium akiainvivens TaxID=1202724 RepID=A0A0M8M9A0_9FLAO|nr:hypothetical protein [Flavobacterium akiainvivens]KOS05185.1 hypothetical protein AM493_03395 [Flavobacterium akiainvivens]SFQ50801.1 hypothetical protein SAMN05444144_106125 [Flavobacterium akiainvivens]